ncbi:hypothetical protein EW145_g5541 [Phellinidium pouzarii]|uniref:NmrA-like domain-containing protein n=1 Tax=Phellinidium pouzarii TaxID=167371 RepID=A0A4S4L064_9AGAM|nr:hypothetical protein EW145_g5541 [Phellinidium pouzarii]
MSTQVNVLILGATGTTGSSIVDALLVSGNFNVIAAVRPSSATKSAVKALKPRGVEIRLVDFEKSSSEQLAEVLNGVDIVISTIEWTQLQLQRPLIDASKKAGVKRFIPCDWGTAGAHGIRNLHDKKLGERDYIKEIGLGYTFIDVGWWMQLTLPIIDVAKAEYPMLFDASRTIYGSGNVKNAVTDRRDIGSFVARIITDARTQDRYVFIWGEEVTQNEVFALAERISGKKFEAIHLSEDALVETYKKAEGLTRVHIEYMYSIWVLGENTVENAKKEEIGRALDARQLYPDLKPRTLEEVAVEVYSD